MDSSRFAARQHALLPPRFLESPQAKRRLSCARTRRVTDRQSCNSPNVLSALSFPASSYYPYSTLFVATPFPFSPIALKHRERKRGCALRHGGLLLRHAPEQVLVPPSSRAPSKKADLGTWEQPHARALRVVCLERLRASKEKFPCSTIQ